MLHYWLTVSIKAFGDSVSFINQSKTGIAFAVLVLLLTALWLMRKHGWRDAVKHRVRTAGEGVVITAIAFVLVYRFHFLFEPYHLQADEQARTNNALIGFQAKQREFDQCVGHSLGNSE